MELYLCSSVHVPSCPAQGQLYFSTTFSRRNARSGISHMHAGHQSILYGPLTDGIPITEFGPAQCQMLFVTAVRELNLRLSLGCNRSRRERVRAQVKHFFGDPPPTADRLKIRTYATYSGPPFGPDRRLPPPLNGTGW